MKKTIYLTILFFTTTIAYSQVGIGTAQPEASAKLDVASTSQGVLFPRMTALQRGGIVRPAAGLMVYQIDGTIGLYHFNGTSWVNLTNGMSPDAAGYTYSSSYGLVSTFAGNGSAGSADGAATASSFNLPRGIAIDASRNVYVADASNNKIRKITQDGTVSTLAGSGVKGSADGTGTAATFNHPVSIAADANGNLYVADAANNKIRKITPAGVVSTFAGSGASGSADGMGTMASFSDPTGIALDAVGNVFVCDIVLSIIRKITPAGAVTTIAGSGIRGYADGAGKKASFNAPSALAVDASGNIFVSDINNGRIRKITPSGEVSTLAGNGNLGFADGPGTTAQFYFIEGVAVDATGNVYLADASYNRIRKVTPMGFVSTIAGSGAEGSADGTGTAATFNGPWGIAIDASSNIVYVVDTDGNRVRKVVVQ